MMNNTSPPRFTATAGTKLVGASSVVYCQFHSPTERVLQHAPSSLTRYSWIKLSFIVQYSTLLPIKAGPFLSPNVADRPLRPAKDHWLGSLLALQQPNPI